MIGLLPFIGMGLLSNQTDKDNTERLKSYQNKNTRIKNCKNNFNDPEAVG